MGSFANDPTTAEFTLIAPNGLFSYLVSVFNAQTVITPKDYVSGTAFGARWHQVKVLEEACYSIIQGSGYYGQYPAVSTVVRRDGK